MSAGASVFATFSDGDNNQGVSATNYTGVILSNSDEVTTRPDVKVTGLESWFRSKEARSFVGKWVMLNTNFEAIDSKDSPGALLQEHAEVISPLIVYVDPKLLGR